MKSVVSKMPKKQRLFHYAKPLHLRQHALAGHLSKELRKQLGSRSIPIRKGDTVRVLTGAKKGTDGKVTGVDYKSGMVLIDKLLRKKVDGTEVPLPVQASNLLVTEVDRSDARRFKRKKAGKESASGEAGEKKEKESDRQREPKKEKEPEKEHGKQ